MELIGAILMAIGAILMALGILIFYFIDRGLKGHKESTKLLIVSILSFFIGAWILFSGITNLIEAVFLSISAGNFYLNKKRYIYLYKCLWSNYRGIFN